MVIYSQFKVQAKSGGTFNFLEIICLIVILAGDILFSNNNSTITQIKKKYTYVYIIYRYISSFLITVCIYSVHNEFHRIYLHIYLFFFRFLWISILMLGEQLSNGTYLYLETAIFKYGKSSTTCNCKIMFDV